ncbi:hypothetical protein L1785_14540 [Antribacter sp. KLBMP9083]|uniref:Tetratricopeptide repeat protein n=1 Tax=Antribacter soli TaxID=2910976 RepID=A0AA41QG76_9MICO|nr:hypothetical protein [Antribacter soli]MCF4122195.1 hypothetical protein [Antribacter soli]
MIDTEGADTSLRSVADEAARRYDPERSAEELVLTAPPPPIDPRVVVRDARKVLARSPRNAVVWTDLALAQTESGELARAHRSISVALSLAPRNRFVVRSAARFYVHVGEPDRARWVLNRAERWSDPWIVSADIAVATILGDAPRSFMRRAGRLLDGSHAARDTSELACGLASLEFSSGNRKSGRRLITLGLENPTENAVAQAEFEAQRSAFELPESMVEVPGSHEAQALDLLDRGEWEPAASAAQKWQADQLFDPDAAMHLSYLASVGLEDFETSRRAAQSGLIANPDNAILWNNAAFAAANLGELAEATTLLERARQLLVLAPGDDVSFTATQGLIEFRSGNIDRGRAAYRQAVESAQGHKLTSLAALAAAYWLQEESLANEHLDRGVIEDAVSLVQSSREKGAQAVLDRVAKRIGLTADET